VPELVGPHDRQRPQHHLLYQRENRRGRPDAESEGEDGDDGKAERLTQHAQTVAQVLPKHLHGTLPKIKRIQSSNKSGPDL
jgi:hypothetical protein